LIVTHSGIRGDPAALTPAVIRRAVGGLLALIRDRELDPQIAVARDERPTGGRLSALVVDTARELGADVVDLGAISTPGAKLATRRRSLSGAIVVTGSHLAPELNGLKLVAAPELMPLDPGALPDPLEPGGRRGRLVEDGGAGREHAAAVAGSVDGDRIRAAGLRVEVEGSAGEAPRLLLQQLGCDGTGPADLRLVLDADGDRLRLVDAGGEPLDEELTLALAVLASDAGTIVKGADTSRAIEALAAERGASVVVVPPGERNLIEAVLAESAGLAGEGNGGVVVPEVNLARDGLAAAALILSLVAETGEPLSSLAGDVPSFHRRRSTIAWDPSQPAAPILSEAARRVGGVVADPAAGLTVTRGEEAWGMVRPSATEPLLRVTVEASEARGAEELHEELRRALAGVGAE